MATPDLARAAAVAAVTGAEDHRDFARRGCTPAGRCRAAAGRLMPSAVQARRAFRLEPGQRQVVDQGVRLGGSENREPAGQGSPQHVGRRRLTPRRFARPSSSGEVHRQVQVDPFPVRLVQVPRAAAGHADGPVLQQAGGMRWPTRPSSTARLTWLGGPRCSSRCSFRARSRPAPPSPSVRHAAGRSRAGEKSRSTRSTTQQASDVVAVEVRPGIARACATLHDEP